MSEDQRRRLTTSEAAAFLGVNAKTLRAWADKGWIDHVRRPGGGAHRWFYQDVLEAFAATMHRGSGATGKLAA